MPRFPSTPGHDVSVLSTRLTDGTDDFYNFAECSCGWRGKARGQQVQAENDAFIHLAFLPAPEPEKSPAVKLVKDWSSEQMTWGDALAVFDGFVSSNAVPPKYRPAFKAVVLLVAEWAEAESAFEA